MAAFSAEDRLTTLDRLVDQLRQDERIDALVLVGSLAGNTADRWSDIDLEVLVAGTADTESVAAEWVRRAYADSPVVSHFEVAFGSSLVCGFLLRNLLEIDLSFVPVADFSAWEPARLLFDRAGMGRVAMARSAEWEPTPPDYAGESGFTWHDVLHAGMALRRGRPWQSEWYIHRIRNRALRLASERRGSYAEFFDYVDDLPPEERQPLEASLVGSLNADALADALEVATRGYLAELRRGDPDLADRLGPTLVDFLTTLREQAGGAFPE